MSNNEMWNHPYASMYASMGTGYNPSPLHGAKVMNGMDPSSSYVGFDKRPRSAENGVMDPADMLMRADEEDDDDDDDEDDDDGDEDVKGSAKKKAKGPDGKPKVKLTRGSRACIACRKIKMRCIPDETTGPNGPCKRCKSGGHECIFEESNRGKRSTRKNEALAMKVQKMEAALKSIGAALSNVDQPALNSFSNALHGATSNADIIQVITSHASPAVVPTLAVAMNRSTYGSADPYHSYYGEASSSGQHIPNPHQPPLSPRLHSLPDNVLSPLGLLAEASLQNAERKQYAGSFGAKLAHKPSPLGLDGRPSPARPGSALGGASPNYRTSDVRTGKDSEETEHMEPRGVAHSNYFKPGSVPVGPFTGSGDTRAPELLTIVTKEEIAELFDLFFDNMQCHMPLIYREFHTAELVFQRSQFLCTVICAIAARFYTKKPGLHSALSGFAKRLAFEVPSRGYKSVEVVQAYLLLTLWTLGPEKTFEQDRTWMMLGMAIRMATDLNLHRKSIPSGLDSEEGRARDLEILNRERCWLHCFILDRSVSSQMGKPYTLREDYIIRSACEATWHRQQYSLPTDRGLASYVGVQQIMSRAIDSIYSSTQTISGLRQDCDYMLIVRSAHEELRRWVVDNPISHFADSGMSEAEARGFQMRKQFYFAYHSLVLYSFGLENALERSKMDISFFLTNVHESATRCCTIVKDHFLPSGCLKYLPDTSFVMTSYALLSLLKLLKPELRPYHDSEEQILKLVTEIVDILEEHAVDASHQPAIYAAFIRQIVFRTKEQRNGGQASRAGSPTAATLMQASAGLNGTLFNSQQATGDQAYDPQLMGQTADWHPGNDLLEAQHFTFIPQGGDMMILPSQAGPPESLQNSPTATFLHNFSNTPGFTGAAGATPAASNNVASNNGWAEYLPTYMSSDGFDGWDGSMLLPGFGRGQITLGGGLLHSQFGSGIITPAQHTPAQSRAASRAASRAVSPS